MGILKHVGSSGPACCWPASSPYGRLTAGLLVRLRCCLLVCSFRHVLHPTPQVAAAGRGLPSMAAQAGAVLSVHHLCCLRSQHSPLWQLQLGPSCWSRCSMCQIPGAPHDSTVQDLLAYPVHVFLSLTASVFQPCFRRLCSQHTQKNPWEA